MDIKVDESRLGERKIIEPGKKEGEVNICIPIKCEDKKGKDIKHYRIDKIEVICDKERKRPKKGLWKKISGNISRRFRPSGKNKVVTESSEIYTPNTAGKGSRSDEDKKTTQILNQENFWCEATVTNKKCINELKKQKKCRMDLTLLPENGDDLKQKITFEVKDEPDVTIGGTSTSKHSFLFLNLLLFSFAVIALTLWNLFVNNDAYGQPFIFKDSWIGAGIGLLLGYFGISIIRLILTFSRTPGDYPALRKYPELFFEKDFIKKMKNKAHFVVLGVVCVITILLIFFLSPIPLPSMPLEHFSYYDSGNDQEIEHSHVYRWNFSNIRIGINKNKRKNKEPFYVAGLTFNKNGDLIPDYYEFVIEDSLVSKSTVLSFEDVGDGKELEENQKHVYDHIYGEKPSDDDIKVIFEGRRKFSVIPVHYIVLDKLEKHLKNFYNVISTKNVDIRTFATDREKSLCSYKEGFIKAFETKTVREEELLYVSEFHLKKMDTSFENDIKRLALVCYQLHASVGYNIKLNGREIEGILKIFESYYKKSNIDGIGDIDRRITQIYFRLLLYLEKNFAEDAYRKMHDSITRVLDNSGGEYYLYYLEECARNNVLFESYLDASKGDSLRITFFEKKHETFRKLRKSIPELKRIYSLKEVDEHSKAFINNLIEKLTPKPPALPLTTSQPDTGADEKNTLDEAHLAERHILPIPYSFPPILFTNTPSFLKKMTRSWAGMSSPF